MEIKTNKVPTSLILDVVFFSIRQGSELDDMAISGLAEMLEHKVLDSDIESFALELEDANGFEEKDRESARTTLKEFRERYDK